MITEKIIFLKNIDLFVHSFIYLQIFFKEKIKKRYFFHLKKITENLNVEPKQ